MPTNWRHLPCWMKSNASLKKSLVQDVVINLENAQGDRPVSVRSEPLQNTSNPSAQYLTSWRLVIVIMSLGLSTCLVALDTSILGVAVPKISTVFSSLDDIAWYGSAYLLTVTAFQPSFGNLYKFFDVKTTYLISIVIFEVGSIVCAAAPSSPVFILGRAIAGLGAAGIFQGALGIVGLIVALDKRPLYMGVVVSVFGIALCLGPVLGGVFTDKVSWRWCFWINVPIGVAVLIGISIILHIKQANDANKRLPFKDKMWRLDPLGVISFIGAICCLLLALQWGGQTLPWSSSKIIGLFIGFGLCITGFCVIQWKLDEAATIPFRILRQRSILMGSFYLFFLGMTVYVYSFYVPLYFQAVRSVSAISSGVRFIALVIPQMTALIIVGAVVTKWGYYVAYMVLGQIICMVGSGLLTRLGINTSTAVWASFLVVAGIGIGMGMQVPYTAVQVVLSESDVPTGNAIAVFSWQLGGAVALSIAQTLFIEGLLHEVPRRTHAVSPAAVVKAGASGLHALAPSPQSLNALRDAYASAIWRTLVFALVAACVALPFALGMERLNVKVVAKRRRDDVVQIG